jgi:ferrous iron transport protein B
MVILGRTMEKQTLIPPDTHLTQELRLSQAKLGRSYIMVDLDGGQKLKERLYSMGLNPGVKFKVIANSGSGPIGIEVRQARLAVGRGMSARIKISEEVFSQKEITIALAGNPNSGKTTIFNVLTGANQHVANYPGVTVEKKEGHFGYEGRTIRVIDLPGTYSLSANSPEEVVACNEIIEHKPDVIVNIVDASNIERNLYLFTQLAELGLPIIIALNMSDLARNRGLIIDHRHLGRLLGVPVIPMVGNKKKGQEELLGAIVACAEKEINCQPTAITYGAELDGELATINELIAKDTVKIDGYPPRWLALKLIEGDDSIKSILETHSQSETINQITQKARARLRAIFGEDAASVLTDKRYGYISGACSESIKRTAEHRHDISDKIDFLLIHPFWGMAFFGFVMWLMFYLTFNLAEKPVELIEKGVGGLSMLLTSILPAGILQSLIVNGIIGGVGGVIVFLPNIMILFLCIAILEDTGYMARAAFIMDRVMHKIGLHGKSFIPMLVGFGCSVPAYMSSRIIEDKTDRLVTMHVTTFMSCGARLPVYVLVCGAFWPRSAGNVMFSIYLLGILIAIGMVKLLRMTRFKGVSAPFVIELPPYRVPTVRSLVLHMGERSLLYIRKAGTMILGVSIIMWFLMSFPQQHVKTFADDNQQAAYNLEHSFAGQLGKLTEPLIKPLGFDWRMGVAIFSGFAAKEVVVSTMGTVYGVGRNADESSTSFRQRLGEDPQYSRLIAYAFLVFVLLYMPCMSAMAVFLRETGSVKELLFQISYTTALAYVMALVVYQGGKLLGLG